MAESCYNCKFYLPATKQGTSGMCRRFPPQFKEFNFMFPTVYRDDWCGEYQFAVDEVVVKRNYNAPFADLVNRVAKAD